MSRIHGNAEDSVALLTAIGGIKTHGHQVDAITVALDVTEKGSL